MEGALVRAGSCGSPLSGHRTIISSSVFLSRRTSAQSVHLNAKPSKDRPRHAPPLLRSSSDPPLITDNCDGRARRFPVVDGAGRGSRAAAVEEEFSAGSGASGRGGRRGGGGNAWSQGGRSGGVGAYYKEMLRADPENPLLLRNYGEFLYEAEGDVQGAEECYGRAILASPRDGELLALYGKLAWEAHGDDERADDYFRRAVQASPDDSHVLGSYAHFLWDAEEAAPRGDESRSSPPAASSPATGAYSAEAF